MHSKFIQIIGLVILMSACASMSEMGTGGIALRKTVKIDTDEFDKTVTYKGITKMQEKSLGMSFAETQTFFIRSFLDKETGNLMSNQVYVSLGYYNDWRYYNQANFVGGESPNLETIDRNVDCTSSYCFYNEHLAIELTSDFLRDNINGFGIKLSSKSGHETIINVTSEQVEKQIKKIENSQYYLET